MNFQQLRIIRETVRQHFNLTEVANALFTSQSGVSKHIKDLEDELGVELFIRKGKRFLGLTDPGKELLTVVERMLLDANNLKRLAEQFRQSDRGQLTLATTHTQARYVLPPVVTAFKKEFPKVHLCLHQGNPVEIAASLVDGESDIGIATESLLDFPELVTFPYYPWRHRILVPKGHPLEEAQPLTLEAIAEYPIITYQAGMTGRAFIDKTFSDVGLSPNIVMSALDADVIKTYVEVGLGIGIIASMAFDAARDMNLSLLDSTHLFDKNITYIAVRRGHYLRGFAYRFIELCSPALNKKHVHEALKPALELD